MTQEKGLGQGRSAQVRRRQGERKLQGRRNENPKKMHGEGVGRCSADLNKLLDKSENMAQHQKVFTTREGCSWCIICLQAHL